MAEPEFVFLEAPTGEGEAPVTPLKRAGRRRALETVLVDLDTHPRRRRIVTRLAIALVIGGGIAAAVVAYRRRRASSRDEPRPLDEPTAQPLGSLSSDVY